MRWVKSDWNGQKAGFDASPLIRWWSLVIGTRWFAPMARRVGDYVPAPYEIEAFSHLLILEPAAECEETLRSRSTPPAPPPASSANSWGTRTSSHEGDTAAFLVCCSAASSCFPFHSRCHHAIQNPAMCGRLRKHSAGTRTMTSRFLFRASHSSKPIALKVEPKLFLFK